MKIGLTACSNTLNPTEIDTIYTLKDTLSSMNIDVSLSNYIFTTDGNPKLSAELKAENLMKFYQDSSITHIADVSGGDTANEILTLLNYDIISKSGKKFMGYSDLTVILNAIYSKTGNIGYLYTIRNLIRSDSENQIENFKSTFIDGSNSLFNFDYSFIQGDSLEGTLIGGNIRCLSKLFGTEYLPDFKDKILFLESLGGGVNQMKYLINQYSQVGVFKKVKGIVLGTFTQMEQNNETPTIEELFLNTIKDIPIIKTFDIGHDANSKMLKIGEHYQF